jgi:glycosyltransferase involved in cell wall biosynthesis
MLLSVIMPLYNERRFVAESVERVLASPFDKEIIIVDDASTDGSREIVQALAREHPSIRVLVHEENRGKGAALQTGIAYATGDIVVIQDADLEYHPEDYAQLLRPIIAGKADVVFGSRFLAGEHRVLYFWHSIGNALLTLLSNAFTNLNLTDMETCYKAFRRDVIQNICLESDRFGFEPEITAKVAKSPCVIYEVPVSYYGRTYEQGKKITWRDGFAALGHIIRFNLFRAPEQCRKRDWTEIEVLVDRPLLATSASVRTPASGERRQPDRESAPLSGK